jgi:DNA-binding NarL/FixJ family response regulator
MLTLAEMSAYADGMESQIAITEAASGSDPDTGLRAVAALRALTERLEILQVDNARRAGWSWQQIAARLGVTKQTVHRKHGSRAGRPS